MRRTRLAAVALAAWLATGPVTAEVPPEAKPVNLPDLVATLLPAVVNISALGQQPGPGGSVAQGGEMMTSAPIKELGSGFIVDPSGYIVTNRHVIAGAYKVTVTLDDGQSYPAEVVSANDRPDLALLKIEAGRALPTMPWGNSDDLRIGQTVIAIGNPLGLASSVSVGVISALNRDISETMIDDFVQTDAALNHGNSGGPLCNLQGQVIGVNWALFSPSAADTGSTGLGLAIPSNDASFVVGEMREFGHLRPGFVGLRLQQVTPAIADVLHLPTTEGGIVTAILPDGPAARAGVQLGDVVLQFGPHPTADVRALLRAIGMTLPGNSAQMVVWHDGATRTLPVAVASWPKDEAANDPVGPPVMQARGERMVSPTLGLQMAALTDEERKAHAIAAGLSGVLVLAVAANSTAADVGVAANDLILRVMDTPVTTPEDVRQALAAARQQGRPAALVLVQSGDRPHWVIVPLKES
jgi:serine protease Do